MILYDMSQKTPDILKNKRTLYAMGLLVVLLLLLVMRFRENHVPAAPDPTGHTLTSAPVFVSVLGDSISTFDGYLPTEPEAYDTWYPRDSLDSVEETWWMRVIEDNGFILLSNASWTGSHVIGDSTDRSGYTGCGDGRADAVRGYHDDGSILPPDIILVFMGANDFLHSLPLGTYTPGKEVTEGEQESFADAYRMLLTKLTERYEDTRICCMTCLPCTVIGDMSPWVNSLGLSITDYNEVIRLTAEEFDATLIDSYACGIDGSNADTLTEDGIHPTAEGAKILADCVSKALD